MHPAFLNPTLVALMPTSGLNPDPRGPNFLHLFPMIPIHSIRLSLDNRRLRGPCPFHHLNLTYTRPYLGAAGTADLLTPLRQLLPNIMLIAFSFSQQSVRILLLQLFAYTSTDIEATASFVCYLRVNNGRRQLEFHLQRSGKVHGELGFNSSTFIPHCSSFPVLSNRA